MPEPYVVPAGQELAVAQALAGPIVNLEPVCALCGFEGADRVEVHRETGERVYVPCYLTWSAAAGVTAAARDYRQMPPHQSVKSPDGVGYVSAWEIRSVKCGGCGYSSAPSAFCRPTGPVYRPSR